MNRRGFFKAVAAVAVLPVAALAPRPAVSGIVRQYSGVPAYMMLTPSESFRSPSEMRQLLSLRDTVRLNSGGPVMHVTGVTTTVDGDQVVQAEWQSDDGSRSASEFPAACLTKIPSESNQGRTSEAVENPDAGQGCQ